MNVDDKYSASKGIVGEVYLVAAATQSVEKAEEGVISENFGESEVRRNLLGDRLPGENVNVPNRLEISELLEDRCEINAILCVINLIFTILVLVNNDFVSHLSFANCDPVHNYKLPCANSPNVYNLPIGLIYETLADGVDNLCFHTFSEFISVCIWISVGVSVGIGIDGDGVGVRICWSWIRLNFFDSGSGDNLLLRRDWHFMDNYISLD